MQSVPMVYLWHWDMITPPPPQATALGCNSGTLGLPACVVGSPLKCNRHARLCGYQPAFSISIFACAVRAQGVQQRHGL